MATKAAVHDGSPAAQPGSHEPPTPAAAAATAAPGAPVVPLVMMSRRTSFRQSLAVAAAESSLPAEYLEALEQKRRQLDESIHKYIASKEREYKGFEKELRARARASGGAPAPASAPAGVGAVAALHDGPGSEHRGHGSRRAASAESSALDAVAGSPARDGRAIGALAPWTGNGRGARRDSPDIPAIEVERDPILLERKAEISGLADRRASVDRDKEFVGVFTPRFIPMLGGQENADASHGDLSGLNPVHASPPAGPLVPEDIMPYQLDGAVQNAAQAKAKRPSQLQFPSRTSSSGSSADGKLASALKSPSQKEPPKRKRVSLAVGDCIVAPSDSVPIAAQSQNHAPSHSRVRKSKPDQEGMALIAAEDSTLVHNATPPSMLTALRVEQIMGAPNSTSSVATSSSPNLISIARPETKDIEAESSQSFPSPAHNKNSSTARAKGPRRSTVDPDGDLFDLEEDSDGALVEANVGPDSDDEASALESEDAGQRTAQVRSHSEDARTHAPGLEQDEEYAYDPEGGLVPTLVSDDGGDDGDDPAIGLDLRVGPSGASQQPIRPGFRRPSVSIDPVSRGSNYPAAEFKAVESEIYSSSYSRPEDKGSFTAGSLGESFMERNAAEMMRLRMAARKEQQVRS